jgi:capsular exopolysaccharide synthesis family protein
MGRIYESLKRAETERRHLGISGEDVAAVSDLWSELTPQTFELEDALSATIEVPPRSSLIAMTDPRCLAAEKFRVLVTRLENLRNEVELKSLLITSSVANEGKTVISGNLAITLAKHSRSRVLLVEGDLHRPALAQLLGLSRVQGLSHWWSTPKDKISHYIYKINGMSLWFLGAGESFDQPSQILQSDKFAETFAKLSGSFDWILVDSTPMLPTADVNQWSRLVDGTLLVVREGVAPIKALQHGLASLDKPRIVGVVFNDTTEFDERKYAAPYFNNSKHSAKNSRKHRS